MLVHDNRTVDDEMWTTDRYNINYGMVALDDEYVRERGLLPAERYPWDASKSVYLLQGYHAMHCVVSPAGNTTYKSSLLTPAQLIFRDLIMDVRDKTKKHPTWPHRHMVHCLHALREEIECYADNFPLYIGITNPADDPPGVGDTRMCRSWDDLRDFAINHTACWSRDGWRPGDPFANTYKLCPDGSKPWEDLELE